MASHSHCPLKRLLRILRNNTKPSCILSHWRYQWNYYLLSTLTHQRLAFEGSLIPYHTCSVFLMVAQQVSCLSFCCTWTTYFWVHKVHSWVNLYIYFIRFHFVDALISFQRISGDHLHILLPHRNWLTRCSSWLWISYLSWTKQLLCCCS